MTEPYLEPETLVAIDRDFGKQQIALERSEWNGRFVYWLRLRHRTQQGWRWAEAKPSSSGRFWASLNVKGRELRVLGNAMLAAADALEQGARAQPGAEPPGKQGRPPNAREQRQIEQLDEHAPFRSNDPSIPF